MKPEVRHQINNHLAVIYGYMQLIDSKTADDEKIQKWMEIVKKEFKKLNEFIETTKS
jgi:hypothetical protein